MIFKRALLKLVLAGKKTETRRLWEKCRVKVGRTYAVRSSRFEKAQGRIRVLATRQERLGAITEGGARREGCASRDDFIEVWKSINKVWTPKNLVWVVTFAVATDVIER